MSKDQKIAELSALLEQERAYVYKLKSEVSDLQSVQHHLVSGLTVWQNGYEKLFHEHHHLAGNERSSACDTCLREHQFLLAELVPSGMLL